MSDFKHLDLINNYCYQVLPLVYDDSLSYYEVLCKVKNTLNDVIENTNQLPEYITTLIKNYITVGAVDEVVRDILANYILNVKYPPQGLPSAVGDGTADDTEAIQGCIDYAAQNGGGLVYIPYGKYLVKSLTMRDNVGLKGFDRYSTELVLAGGAESAALNGKCNNVSVTSLKINANSGNQVNDVDCIDFSGSNYLLSDLVLDNGYNLVSINGESGVLQCDNIVFLNTVHCCFNVSDTIAVQLTNCMFNALSAVGGDCVLAIGSDHGNYNFTTAASVETAVKLTGNNNSITAVVQNAQTAVADSGINNNIDIKGTEKIEEYANGVNSYAKTVAYHVTEDFFVNCGTLTLAPDDLVVQAGTIAESAVHNKTTEVGGLNKERNLLGKIEETTGDSTESVTGSKTVTVGGDVTLGATSIAETCTNKKEVSCATLTETVTGTKTVNTENSVETVDGSKDLTVSNISVTASQHLTIDVGADLTEDVQGSVIRSASSITETVTGDKTTSVKNNTVNCDNTTINTTDIYINCTNPIKYGNPAGGTFFNTLDMLDESGNRYQLLVGNENTQNLGSAGEMAHVLDGQRQYIDQVNGDDTNDGTEQHPWKSLTPFFNQANSTKGGRVDIRCYIVSAGTYTIPPQSYNNLTIHITGNVDGVILNFETPRDVKFYECHTNLKNITINAPNATEFAFDGGSISCHNCTFNHRLVTYACSGYLYQCNIKSLDAQTSTLIINSCNLTNTDPSVNGWEFHTCLVRFQGSSQNASLTVDGDDNSFIYAVGSYIVYGITYRLTDYKYKYGLTAVASYITTNQTQYNNLKRRSVSGVTASEFGSMIILNDGLNEVNAGTLGGNVRYADNKLQYYSGSDWVDVPVT